MPTFPYGGCSVLCAQVGGEKRSQLPGRGVQNHMSLHGSRRVLARRCDRRRCAQAALGMGMPQDGQDYSNKQNSPWYETILQVRPRRGGFEIPLTCHGLCKALAWLGVTRHAWNATSHTIQSQLLSRWAFLSLSAMISFPDEAGPPDTREVLVIPVHQHFSRRHTQVPPRQKAVWSLPAGW